MESEVSFDALERALVELVASGELNREQSEQIRERYMVEIARPEDSIAPVVVSLESNIRISPVVD